MNTPIRKVDPKIVSKQKADKASRFRDRFPFPRDLEEYPITREHQYPPMPIRLSCVESDLHLCFEVVMSDGNRHGGNQTPLNFRLDPATVVELHGTVPEGPDSSDLSAWNKAGDASFGGNHDIELTPDGIHPLNLLPAELSEYFRKLPIIYKRSTTPKDVVNDFDDI